MNAKPPKRKTFETLAGVAIGAAIAGPVGAVAGGLAAGHVESGLEKIARLKPPRERGKPAADDPIVHVRPKRILVPLDFSPPSRRAMRFAEAWAGYFRAEVVLLHVLQPPPTARPFGAPAPVVVLPAPRSSAVAVLRDLARKEFPDSVRVMVMVRKGTAHAQIAAAAADLGVDLIIIASHGYTGLKRVVLGSTAELVARHAPCPVLILRRGKRRRRAKEPR